MLSEGHGLPWLDGGYVMGWLGIDMTICDVMCWLGPVCLCGLPWLDGGYVMGWLGRVAIIM